MTKVIDDPGKVNSVILELFNMMAEVFKSVLCLVIAIVIDWKLTLGVLIIAPPLAISVKKYSRRLKKSGKAKQEAISTLNTKLQETLSGIRVIKAFATEEYEIKDFMKKSTKLKTAEQMTARNNAKSNAISEALSYVMIALLLMFGGYRVVNSSNFTAGDFVTIVGAISSMYTPIMRSIKRWNTINVYFPSVNRVFEILEIEEKVVDKENCVDFTQFKDEIKFNNVEFYYENNGEKILKGINLNVNQENCCIRRNSGGGNQQL